MKFPFFACLVFVLVNINSVAQDLSQMPGTFNILKRTNYASAECGYTKAEMTANLQCIVNVINVVKQNPVLAEIKGFNGRARIYNDICNLSCNYGIPSRISFEFSSFFRNKSGKVVFNTIEPPSWSIYLNKIIPGMCSSSFDRDKCYFTVPLNKKTISPGIDVYNEECFIIYDTTRPPYWLPVTVDEAFASVREFIARDKDPVSAAYQKEFVDRDYAEIAATDRNKPAYFGGNLSRISVTSGYGGQENLFPRIMKVNPAYWNKALSEAAVQIISFGSAQNKKYLKNRFDECLGYQAKGSGSGCDLARFELSYSLDDIRKLLPLIGK